MSSGDLSTYVATAIALLVVVAGAVGGVAGATGGTTFEATSDSLGADRPANATVMYGYVSGTSGNVTLATANGTQIDTGVSAVVAGQGADLDDDGTVEVPYVTGQQTLGVVDRHGNTTHLADAAEETKTKMAIGDLNGDGEPRVYYARDSSTAGSELRWANASGGTGVVVSKDTTAMAALGVADVTGDGVDEIVFVGSSGGLRYYNESANEVVTFYTSDIGSNSGGLGVGAPRDFDNDGVAETPIVDGSNNALLVDADGTTETVVTGGVDKSPVAGVEVDSAEGLELLYAVGNDVKYATMTGDTGRMTDADGNDVGTTSDAGVAWMNAPDEPFVVESVTLSSDPRNLTLTVQVSEEAEELTANVSGPDSRNVTLSAFNTTQSGGSWNYTTTYRPNETGEYTASVDHVRSVDGDETTTDETDSATVQEPYNVSALNATADAGALQVQFNATHPTDGVDAVINGSDNLTLDGSDFTTSDSSAPYVYTATAENATGGNYTVTLDSATAEDGRVDDENLTDDAYVPPFDAYNLTLSTTADGNLSAGFSATHDVTDADLSLSGPGNESVSFGAFDEVGTDPYRYEHTLNVSTDGNWTLALDSATAADGRVDDETLTANATVDQRTPTVLNATLTDATDENAVVNESDSIRVAANVSGDVDAVRADLSAFGAGTVDLTPADDADYAATVAVENGSQGDHVVTVTAVDGQGNADTATTGEVTLDTTAPTVSVGDDRTVTVGTTVTLTVESSDNVTWVASERWTAEGAPNSTGGNWSGSYEDPGEYAIQYAATDAAGNSATETVNVTVEQSTSTTDATASTPTPTPTPTSTSDSTPAPTAEPTATPTVTSTSSNTAGETPRPTGDGAGDVTPGPTATSTAGATGSATAEATPSPTRTAADDVATVAERRTTLGSPSSVVGALLALLLVLLALLTLRQEE